MTGPLRTDEEHLVVWCIYEKPLDHPEHFVLRRWIWNVPDRECQLFGTLEEARAAVPGGLVPLDRHPQDDPAVKECWI